MDIQSEKHKEGQKGGKWVRKVKACKKSKKQVRKMESGSAKRVRKAESRSEKQKMGQKSRNRVKKG